MVLTHSDMNMVPQLRYFVDQKWEKRKSRHQKQKPTDLEKVHLILTPPKIDPKQIYSVGIGLKTNKKTLSNGYSHVFPMSLVLNRQVSQYEGEESGIRVDPRRNRVFSGFDVKSMKFNLNMSRK